MDRVPPWRLGVRGGGSTASGSRPGLAMASFSPAPRPAHLATTRIAAGPFVKTPGLQDDEDNALLVKDGSDGLSPPSSQPLREVVALGTDALRPRRMRRSTSLSVSVEDPEPLAGTVEPNSEGIGREAEDASRLL